MDPRDVDRQVRQMVDFIKLEAREKANEIRMKVRCVIILAWGASGLS